MGTCVDCGGHTHSHYGNTPLYGIANSFSNALKWTGINLWEEEKRWAANRKENQ